MADHTLTSNDSLHAHLSGNVILTQAHTLSSNDSLHAHLVDRPVLPCPLVMVNVSLVTSEPINITLKPHGTE